MVADREKPEVKAFERQILEAESEIEQATSKLFDLETVLKKFCDDVCQNSSSPPLNFDIPFDFANISLVMPIQNTIEAVYGSGIAERWANRARHYLVEDSSLQDIQANIVKTHQTEIISGWDERFDRWIYDTFNHERLIRIFTPILLIRDRETGKMIKDWFDRYPWEENFILQESNREGQCTTITMRFSPEFALPDAIEVIGTVEAGYEDRQTRTITYQQAVALAKLTARNALAIHEARLSYVLETIAEKAKDILQADSATLHFMYKPPPQENYIHYIYEVCAGNVSHLAVMKFPPYKDGLGWQAICERKPKCILDPSQSHDEQEVARFNPKASEGQSKAYAAFPLHVDGKQWAAHGADPDTVLAKERCQELLEASLTPIPVGVLYVHFQREHHFTEDEMRWGQLFANRAADAIRHVMTYRKVLDRARQLGDLHSIAQSFTQLDKKDDLLRHIAWAALNTLAADVITIHEYIAIERKFLVPPAVAGRLREERKVYTEIDVDDVPFQIVKRGESVYTARAEEEPIFIGSEFAEREGVKSVAGVLLKVGLEIVGVMFVNYRRLHDFSDEEKRIIETLSSHAAIAIKNQRWLEIISDIDRKIIGTLDKDKLLSQILRQARQITAADTGVIRLLDPIHQELVLEAKYPEETLVEQRWARIRVGEGITGWVAQEKKPALVNNVRNDSRYKAFSPDVQSEICVPLLDKDHRLLGVVNMESYRLQAFDTGHQRMLEALADLAVIAIQNVKSKEQSIAIEKIMTLGDLAGPLMHRMNSYLGAIQVWAQRILIQGNHKSKSAAVEIQSLAGELLREADLSLLSWLNESLQTVDLCTALHEAIKRVHLANNITQAIHVPDDLPKVEGGEQQLTHVFYNLIQNAKEAMPSGGTLSVICREVRQEESSWVVVEVSDTGVGIAAEDLPKIFQLGYTTKPGHGGFGLWWTHTYIKRLSGTLSVESSIVQESDKGAKFIVLLPKDLMTRNFSIGQSV